MRQSVRLTGISTPKFQACTDALQRLHEKLGRHVQDGAMEPLANELHGQHISIEFGNRYFTNRRDDPQSPTIPFNPTVDPNGILSAVSSNDEYFHGPDNEVLYYYLTTENGTQKSR
jgi:hypothetical protein